MKKILSMVLVVCMGLILFSAYPAMATELPEITLMTYWEIGALGNQEFEESYVAQKWQEDVGFKLVTLNTPLDTYGMKFNTMLASNDLPDIACIYTSNGADLMNEYGPKNVFANLSEHKDKLPNFFKLMEQYPVIEKVMQSDDGNIYGFPGLVCNFEDIMYTTPVIRKDLLEKDGITLESIVTLEDLTNALRALKDDCVGGAPWIQRNGYKEFMQRAGLLFDTCNTMWWDAETDTYQFPSHSERFRALVTWLNLLYSEGLIHPDWTTMSDDNWEGLLAAGSGAFCIDRMSLCGDPTFDQTFEFRPILNPEVDGERAPQAKRATVNATNPWIIRADCPNLDKALEAFDYLFAEENWFMFQNGIEGLSYEKGDQTLGGINWLCKAYGLNANNPEADHYGIHGFQKIERVRTKDVIMNFYPKLYPELFFQQVDLINENGGFAPDQPQLKFTVEEFKIKNGLETALLTYVDENVVMFVEGSRPLDEWEDFMAEIEGMGLAQVQKVYDDALARWNAL